MLRLREGIEIPIVPEDFVIARKKTRPERQSTSLICVKHDSLKIGLKAGRTRASGKRRT